MDLLHGEWLELLDEITSKPRKLWWSVERLAHHSDRPSAIRCLARIGRQMLRVLPMKIVPVWRAMPGPTTSMADDSATCVDEIAKTVN